MAMSLLVFLPLLSVSVLMMTVYMAIDGQPLQLPLIAVFGVVIAASTALAWLTLKARQEPPQGGMMHTDPVPLRRLPIR